MSQFVSPKSLTKKLRSSSEEDNKTSQQIFVRKRIQPGYVVRPRKLTWDSGTSTSSLAQLQEKLALLPKYTFEREALQVCAIPELSTVTELSEVEDSYDKEIGFSVDNIKNDTVYQNECEIRLRNERNLSPIVRDENSTSCLLVATVGSNESVINDTIEKLNKNKYVARDNFVDLLVKQAFQNDNNDKNKYLHTGVNTDHRKSQVSTEINNFGQTENYLNTEKTRRKFCTVISNSTTEESNDVICESQLNFINNKKRFKVIDEVEKAIPGIDANVQEDFFSRHLTSINSCEIVISPTLARKINETSSEGEDYFDDGILQMENNEVRNKCNSVIESYDVEVFQCLESILEQVCSNIEKCVKILNSEKVIHNFSEPEKTVCNVVTNIDVTEDNKNQDSYLKEGNKLQLVNKRTYKTKSNNKLDTRLGCYNRSTTYALSDQTKDLISKKINNCESNDGKSDYSVKESNKLKRPTKKIHKRKSKNKINKLVTGLNSCDMSTSNAISNDVKMDKISKNNSDTPLTRRKRKLYSPTHGDHNISKVKSLEQIQQLENNNIQTSKTQTSSYEATSYKDIEKDRKRFRQPRTRKSRNKPEHTLSPKTKKQNDIFDQLKDQEYNKNMNLVNKDPKKMAVYNFTNDSEDEDFKKNTLDLRKRANSNLRCDRRSIVKKEIKKDKQLKSKRNVRRKQQPKSKLINGMDNLVDETMRGESNNDLNTSLEMFKPIKSPDAEPVLKSEISPKMDYIPDTSTEKTKIHRKKVTKDKVAGTNTNDNTSISPLPELMYEIIPQNIDDENDSISLQKLQRILHDPSNACINHNNTSQNFLTDTEAHNCTSPLRILEDFNSTFQNKSINEIPKITKNLKGKEHKLKKIESTEIDSDKSPCSPDVIEMNTELMKNIQTKHRKQNIKKKSEVLQNPSGTYVDSDKTIRTVGRYPITAHGDSDETPPNLKLLTENIKPRDLEIEYLDESTKTYYKDLTDALLDKQTTSENTNTKLERLISKSITDCSKIKSPIVSIPRLSDDDIFKWLPSRRESYTYSSFSKQTSLTNSQLNKNDNDTIFDIDGNVINDFHIEIKSDNSQFKSPEIGVESTISTRLLSKSAKILNPTKYREESYSKEFAKTIKIQETNKSCQYKRKRHDFQDEPTTSKWLRSNGNKKPLKTAEINITSKETKKCIRPYNEKKERSESVENININVKKTPIIHTRSQNEILECFNSVKSINKQKKMSPTKCLPTYNEGEKRRDCMVMKDNLTQTEKEVAPDKLNRKSLISPIKMFDEIFPTNTSNNEEIEIRNISRTEYSNTERNTIGRITVTSLDSKVTCHSKTMDPQNVRLVQDETVDKISESDTSIFTVNEWFKRNTSYRDRADNISSSYIETIQNIMEKLETSITEIHHHTSKRFVHMFLNAQTQLVSEMERRRQHTDALAKEILDKFSKVEQRSREFEEEFMQQLKKQAIELIHEESKKKKLVVKLLKEDIQTVLDHVDRERSQK